MSQVPMNPGQPQNGNLGGATRPQPEILKHFAYRHLAPGILQATSKRFHDLAHELAEVMPPSAEAATALRKLLEGKDAAVRAVLGLTEQDVAGRAQGTPQPADDAVHAIDASTTASGLSGASTRCGQDASRRMTTLAYHSVTCQPCRDAMAADDNGSR